MANDKKRYVLVGTGGRAVMYTGPLVDGYKSNASLEAMCDLSQTRMDWHNLRLKELYGASSVPTYLAGDFDRMIKEKKPHCVIVVTTDYKHHEYIIRAMELGCDVISEKPMTVDAPNARAIFDTIKRTGRSLRVTFNARYAPLVTKVKELMKQGVVGTPKHVSMTWMLDTRHGADYFHRWHREKDKSGGLLVHKSTHHFDMINWWIDSYPKTVFAVGDLMFYGKKNAEARGEKYSYDRYTGRPEAKNDPFAIFLDEDRKDGKLSVSGLQGLYLNAEKETGYLRDRNVFGEGITVEDAISLTARYRSGAIFSYSLVAFSPWEGYHVAITGDKGRLEVSEKHGSHVIRGQSEEQLAAEMGKGHDRLIRVYPMFGAPYDVEPPKGEGSHGGGDKLLLEDLFGSNPPADPFGRAASHIDGAASMLMGISANESMRTGLPVHCDDLVKLPDAPAASPDPGK